MNKDVLIEKIQNYRISKGWDQSDTLHNLAKSIFIESAELLECFKDEQTLNPQALQDELADVLMYAISLAIDLGVDLEEIIEEKWQDVDKRYADVD